jgi:hypothetical protein
VKRPAWSPKPPRTYFEWAEGKDQLPQPKRCDTVEYTIEDNYEVRGATPAEVELFRLWMSMRRKN